MPDPWDRPPLVLNGDKDPNLTFQYVGRVLSQWEGVEIQLGYIYTAVVGKHGDWWALQDYGAQSGFKRRFSTLEKALDSYFIKHPSQEVEGKLKSFLEKVDKFAARRHDVAHAIVRDRSWAPWRVEGADTTGYFLLPAHYKRYDADTFLPLYAYTAQSMEDLRHQLIQLETEAMGMAKLIERHAGG
jgi:hypothetical protein